MRKLTMWVIIVMTAVGGVACRLVVGANGWAGQPYSVTIAPHITGCGQSPSGSAVMMLDHDVPCTIQPSVLHGGDEVLTSSGRTLVTNYKLTGADLQDGDATWVTSANFLSRTYNCGGTGPASQITLSVQAASSANRADEAGAYSASIVLTASW